MKKITLIALMLFTALGYSQVGINTNNPDASSALEIESTTGGILIPRLTETQRDDISAPATGLMIYQTNGTSGFYFWDGAAWTKIDGVAGPQGTNGTDGADGTNGVDGTNGADGVDGAQGPIGLTGAAGVDGTNGTDGADGTNGLDGLPGAAGVDGTNGTDGADGTNGLDGLPGAAGVDGTNGTDGADGTNGLDGLPGAAGIDGTNGSDGVDGTNGTDGADGVDGSNGIDGAQGAQGDTGIQGINGSTAYELWQDAGNIGTEAEFLASLVGPEGPLVSGTNGQTLYNNGTEWVATSNLLNSGASVGIGLTATIDASAVLQIESTTQGVLFPKMSSEQRDLIATPQIGLLIFQIDNSPGFYFYDGTAWVALDTSNGSSSGGSDSKTLIYTTNGF